MKRPHLISKILQLFTIVIAVILLMSCNEKKKNNIIQTNDFVDAKELEAINLDSIDESRLVERNGLAYKPNSETPFTGKVFRYYQNGQKALAGSYLSGIKEGKWDEWYQNGQKKFDGAYHNGNYNGRILTYSYGGQITENLGYLNGTQDGKQLTYYSNGQLQLECSYVSGQSDGAYSEYYEDGTPKLICNFKNGILDGECWSAPENNNRVKCFYKNGELEGQYVEYHGTGKPAFFGDYHQGLKEGAFKYNYPNGNRKKIVQYLHDQKSGLCTFYCDIGEFTFAPDKQTLATMNYQNDKLDGKYVSYAEHDWLCNDNDVELTPPTWGQTYKVEGCFKEGRPEGLFKYWKYEGTVFTPRNELILTKTYARQVYEKGNLIDDGWIHESGYVIIFNEAGIPLDRYKESINRYNHQDRFAKIYKLYCE